jgi:predicted amidohydrolase YtcJ
LSESRAPVTLVRGRPLCEDAQGRLAIGEPLVLELSGGCITRVEPSRRTERAPAAGHDDAVLVPGWIDSHVHLLASAADRAGLDLSETRPRSLGELLDRIARASRDLPTTAWVRASGYDESFLAERRHPTREELDVAAGGRRVRLRHATRHASVLSSVAFADLAGHLPHLPAEHIPRDDDGRPLGIVFGSERILSAAVGPLSRDEILDGLGRVSAELAAAGVVSVDEMTAANDAARVATLAEAVAAGRLRQRVRVFLGRASEWGAARAAARGLVEIAGVKLLPENAAEITRPGFAREVGEARGQGLPVAVHAVEADAIDAALDVLATAPPRSGASAAPDRIEHGSLCPPEIVRRLADQRVAVVTQPAFLFERGDKYRDEVEPPLWPWLYPIRSLLSAGVLVAGSSDAPVATSDPRLGIDAAMRRRTASGIVLAEFERLDESTALGLYTRAPRRLRGETGTAHWWEVGERADVLVLDRDPRGGLWRDVGVEATIVGGAVWRGDLAEVAS